MFKIPKQEYTPEFKEAAVQRVCRLIWYENQNGLRRPATLGLHP